ncbi:YadA-like family protein [Mannheimia bovis]|uniref:YadA-like family protein n=1 Tax=Mannheimia bovis TaxID=2770636 RepID=A0A7H1C0E3_9PAST|nr:YadA-like family protein [Mannheimia bovis]QNS14448.1 YadA-like family protein [Mannheimia bovis]
MNNIFKVIWNHSTQSFVVASELAKSQGKSSTCTVGTAKSAGNFTKGLVLSALSSAVMMASGVASAATLESAGTVVATTGDGTLNLGANQASGSIYMTTGNAPHAMSEGKNSISIGSGGRDDGAWLNGQDQIFIGMGIANQDAYGGVAIGNKSRIGGGNGDAYGTTVGYNSQAYTMGVAMGAFSNADIGDAGVKGDGAIHGGVSIGAFSHVDNGNAGTAVGTGAYSNSANSTAIGAFSRVQSNNSTAMGNRTNAASVSSIAIGDGALTGITYAANSTSIGQQSVALGSNAIAIGKGAISGNDQGMKNVYASQLTEAQATLATAQTAYTKAQEAYNAAGAKPDIALADALAKAKVAVERAEENVKRLTLLGEKTDGTLPNAGSTIAIGDVAKAQANRAIAVGYNANASGLSSVAMGDEAKAKGKTGVAIGQGATTAVTGDSNIAIGQGASADGLVANHDAIAIGARTETKGQNAVAIGAQSKALANGALAVAAGTGKGGSVTTSQGEFSIAIGAGTQTAVGAQHSVAVGSVAEAKALYGSAFGPNAKANTGYATALGGFTTATGEGSTAVGLQASTNAESALAVGRQASASGLNSMAMGKNAQADSLANIAIGENAKAVTADKNTGDKDGKKDDNAGINKAIAIGSNAQATNAKTIAIGDAANASGKNANAIGSQAVVSGEESTGIGTAVSVTGSHATGIGQRANAAGTQSVAIGTQSITTAYRATAIGRSATAAGSRATALSADSSALGSDSLAMGAYARTTAASATAVGHGADGVATNAVALGRKATGLGTSSIAIGENAIAGGNAVAKEAYNSAYKTAYEAKEKAIYDEVFAATSGTEAQKTAAADAAKIARQAEIIAAGHQAGQAAIANAGIESIAIGKDAIATGTQSIAIGVGNLVSGNNAGAFGDPSIVAGAASYTFGNDNVVGSSTTGAFALGNNNQMGATPSYQGSTKKVDATQPLTDLADVSGSVAIGNENKVTTKDTFILGSGINTAADGKTAQSGTVANSVYLGKDSTAVANVGNNKTATDANGATTTGGATGTVNTATVNNLTYIGFAGVTSAGAVTVGSAGAERRLMNVAAGQISSTSTDAINGSQLYAVADKLGQGFNVLDHAGATKGTVTPGENVQFVNGTNTTAKVTEEAHGITKVTFDVTLPTATITQNPGSSRFNVTAAQGDNYVTARNMVTALNNTGFFLAVAPNGGEATGDPSDKKIAHGDTFTLTAGENIAINQIDNGYEISAKAPAQTVVSGGNGTTVTNVGTAEEPNYQVIARVDGNTVVFNGNGQISANTTTYRPGTTGTVGNPNNPNALVNAQTIANAINQSGFNVTAGSGVDGGSVTGKSTELVNPGETVTFDAGKNMKLVQENGKFTYATKDDVSFNDVTANKVTAPTITTGGTNPVTISNNTITGLNTTLAENPKPAQAKPADIANKTSNAATIGDVLNAGWNLKANDQDVDFVKPYDTVEFKDGLNTKVVAKASEDGKSSELVVNVVGLPVSYTTATGEPVVKVGDKFYKVDDKGEPTGEALTEEEAGKLVANMVNPSAKPNELGNSITLGNLTSGVNLLDGTNRGDKPTADTPTAIDVSSPLGKSLKDAYNGLADLANAPKSNAVTVGDLRNLGWVVSATGNDYADDVRHANEVRFVGKGLATVTGETKDDVRTITVDVDAQDVVQNAQLPVVYTKADGTKVELANDGNFYPEDKVNADGSLVDGTTAADQVAKGDVIASLNSGDNDTTSPTTLANVKGNLPTVNDESKVVNNPDGTEKVASAVENITKAPLTAQQAVEVMQKSANNAATVGDVLNAGWNLKANDQDVDFVKPYDTVEFKDGLNTKVVAKASEDGKSSELVVNVVGLPVSYTTATGEPVVKVGDKFYKVDDKGEPTGEALTEEEAGKLVANMVNPSAKPNELGNSITLGNLTSGVNLLDGTNRGDKPTADTPTAIDVSSPLGKSLKDAYNGLADLANAPKSNAVTVGDLRNLGWVVSATGNDYADDVRHANEVRFVGKGLATVTGETKDDVRTITVDVDAQDVVQNAQLPVVYTKADGTKVELANDGNFYPEDKVNADGSLVDGTTAADQVAKGDVIASLNSGDNDTTSPTTLANVKGNLPTVNDESKVVNNPDGTEKVASAVENITKAPLTAQQAVEVMQKSANNAATVGDVLNAGWNLKANDQDVDFVKPYDTVEFKDGLNTKVVAKASEDGKSSELVVNVVGLPVSYTTATGEPVVKVGDKFYKVDDKGEPTGEALTEEEAGKLVANMVNPSAKPNELGNSITLGNLTSGVNLLDGTNRGDKPTADTPTAIDVSSPLGKSLKDAYNGLADLANAPKSNAVTVGDLRNLGWVVSATGNDYADDVRHANEVRFVGKGLATVTGETKDGVRTITVDTTKLEQDIGASKEDVVSSDGSISVQRDVNPVTKATTFDVSVNTDNTTITKDKDGQLIAQTVELANDQETGKVNVPTIGGQYVGNSLVTAKTVADAINNSGFKLTTSKSDGEVAGTTTELINPSDTVTIDAGQNIAIVQAGGKISVATSKNVKFDSVESNSVTVPTSNGSSVMINNKGIDLGGNRITNVAAGVADTDAVNVSQLKDVQNSINNSGFTLKASGNVEGNATPEKIGQNGTVEMVAGKNLTVKQEADGKITYATANDVDFNNVTATNSIGITNGPTMNTTGINAAGKKVTSVADGDISPTSTDAVNGSQIYALSGGNINKVGDYTVTNPDGTKTTYQNVVLDENGEPVLVTYNVKTQGEHITNSVITAINNMNTQGIKFFHTNDGKADSTRPADQRYNSEDSSASGAYATAVGYQSEASGTSSVAMGNNSTAAGENAIAIGVNSQANAKNTISIGNGNIVNGENSGAFGDPSVIDATNSYSVGNNNTIAAGQSDVFALGNEIKETTSNSVFLGSKSGSFEQKGSTRGNNGVHKKTANSNYTYKGENDANVAGVENAVGVVSVGNANETRQIQGVAAGVVSETSTDAINGSQLHYTNKAIGDVKNDINKLGNAINKNNRNLRAGIAGANAAAGLPQVYLPGKSMVAASAGTFKGEGALAVGYSRASDNGKVILKLQGNANTRGEVGGSVGVGYQW